MLITDFISTGFYFSAALSVLSAFLLAALYCFRWKSDLLSLALWLVVYSISGWITLFITHDLVSVLIVLGINLLCSLAFFKLKPVVSFFGMFLLSSMISPIFFGLCWIFQLIFYMGHYVEAGWPLYFLLATFGGIFSILIIFNTIMSSWVSLARYSPLFFLYPRLQEGLKISNQSNSQPMVSIHVPCFNEPPEIVMETLNALSRLDYPLFEVIVLDNNTKDSSIWKPIETHCQSLGERFRFYHFDQLQGAKAGALNCCIKLTVPEAKFISVIDADYIIKPNFLKRLIGFFEDPKLGFVQACQDYRGWRNNHYLSACYYEYEKHFRLELSGINEWDMSYTIGTVCILRRSILEEVGGWAEWCLTEDSEVAVRVHALGYTGHYLKESFGYGLIPETFESFKQQRFRWTAGPPQQLQRHWRLYLPWCSYGRLTLMQKFGELSHSLLVFFKEFLNFLISFPLLVFCLWLSLEKQHSLTVPYSVVFLILASILNGLICNSIYIWLLGGRWKDHFFSSIARRSLLFTRIVACYKGWMSKNLKWKRTYKFKVSTNFRRSFYSSRWEMLVGLVYITIAFFLFPFTTVWKPNMIFLIWLGFVNQAISFLCAPLMAFLSEKTIGKSESL